MKTNRSFRTAAAALSAAAALAVPAAAQAATYFESPSGNIVCKATSGSLKCDVESEDVGVTLGRYSAVRWTYARDAFDYGDWVLEYGETVNLGPFTCASDARGIECWSRRSDNGFFLSTERQYAF